MLAHLLRAGGQRTALAGNIGLPLLELLDADARAGRARVLGDRAVELPDRRVADSGARPDVAVALNVFPEHLDWHGGEARYVDDKLRLLTEAQPRIAVLNAADPTLAALRLADDSEVRWFDREDGWHLRGDALYRGDALVMDTAHAAAARPPQPRQPVRGAGGDRSAGPRRRRARAARRERSGRCRIACRRSGTRDGIAYVNDSISTTPHASLAALDCFADRRVAILVGGHDRGIDWSAFRRGACARMRPRRSSRMGQNGPRIHELLEPVALGGGFALRAADDLADAMRPGARCAGGRGRRAAVAGRAQLRRLPAITSRAAAISPQLAGFDPDTISAIPGLGIA